jgi:hypothetical protein
MSCYLRDQEVSTGFSRYLPGDDALLTDAAEVSQDNGLRSASENAVAALSRCAEQQASPVRINTQGEGNLPSAGRGFLDAEAANFSVIRLSHGLVAFGLARHRQLSCSPKRAAAAVTGSSRTQAVTSAAKSSTKPQPARAYAKYAKLIGSRSCCSPRLMSDLRCIIDWHVIAWPTMTADPWKDAVFRGVGQKRAVYQPSDGSLHADVS